MSSQTRYGITFGSGELGVKTETRLRQAAEKEGVKFSVWIKLALESRANQVLGKEKEPVIAK